MTKAKKEHTYTYHVRVTLEATVTVTSGSEEDALRTAVDECRACGDLADWEVKELGN